MAKKGKKILQELTRVPINLIILFMIVAVVAIYVIGVVSAQEPMKFVPPTDQPKAMPAFGNTATPNETDIANNQILAEKTIYPSSTPLVIGKEIDLSPTLKDYDKYLVIVTRADGTNEEIKVGPATHDLFETQLPDDILAKLNLEPGDKITSWYDIAIREAHNNNPTATYIPLPGTPTSIPSDTSTPIPYP